MIASLYAAKVASFGAGHMEQPRNKDLAQRFTIGAELGSGAIARVVRVLDEHTGAVYAGKILHPRHERDEAARTRFRREAELASHLRHDNLVVVYGIFEVEGSLALLMELVEGPTLATHLARHGPLPPPQVVELAHGIAAGLAFAHSMGVIHRDLKPANVLLAPGPTGAVPKLADFGMARAASFADADRRAMTVLGTPPYMAPECLEPLAVDPRTDLYALGCMVHELATGIPPFAGATGFAVLEAHRNAPIPELPEHFPPRLRQLVARLLAKSPGDRPQSASVVMHALAAIRDGQATGWVAPTSGGALTLRNSSHGSCAGCGEPILPDVRVCFACGLVQVVLEPGPMSVFVVGPGKISDKLDTVRRERLVKWLRGNAAVGFDPAQLERKIPRVPFALISGVSPLSASTLMTSLERLDIQSQSRIGGSLAHRGVVKNALKMTGRRLSIVGAIFATPALIYPPFGLVTVVPALIVAFPIILGGTLLQVRRASVANNANDRRDIPPALQSRIDGLHREVEGIGQRRHREALRAVVERIISLTRATPAHERAQIDTEASRGVALAVLATRRMDELDRHMERDEFDPACLEHRAQMKERDMWSARLLDLTATLDALAARRAAAEATNERLLADELVTALHHTVEALEEVSRT
jgi:tRNA A-37 threonylcarbamoyl transferase component Bud32